MSAMTLTEKILARAAGRDAVAPNDNVKGKERMLIKAIPEHRIQSIK